MINPTRTTERIRRFVAVACAALCAVSAGCGLKGELYLPAEPAAEPGTVTATEAFPESAAEPGTEVVQPDVLEPTEPTEPTEDDDTIGLGEPRNSPAPESD